MKPQAGAAANECELQAFCAAHMPNHDRPLVIRFVDVLPKTPLCKIQKAVIHRECWGTLRR